MSEKARNLLDESLEIFTLQVACEAFGKPSDRRDVIAWDYLRLRTARDWPMLVLSRKKDESIVINDDITIVVVEIRGDKVRLGVEAPKEVPVHRREVFEAIARGEPIDLPTAPSASQPGSSAAVEPAGDLD